MQEVKYKAKLNSRGELIPLDSSLIKAKRLKYLTQGIVEVTEKTINPKTYAQIKTIHGPILDHLNKIYLGNGKVLSKIAVKERFKILVGYYDTFEGKNGPYPRTKSFSKATKGELTKMIDFYVNWSIELGEPIDIND
jgi:hypothetical protein